MVDMLHNMSMRPSTRVQWGIAALWERQACFKLGRCGLPKGSNMVPTSEPKTIKHRCKQRTDKNPK